MSFLDELVNLIKQPDYYKPRNYQTIGGFWTVDEWERCGIKYQIMDEGCTERVVSDDLDVYLGFLNTEYIRYDKGNEEIIKNSINSITQSN